MHAVVAPLPVGKIKSFGPFGPKYEVGQALRQSKGVTQAYTVRAFRIEQWSDFTAAVKS